MKDRPAPPQQIVGAWQAWLATRVLQVAGALTTLAINLLDPGALLEVPGLGGRTVGDSLPELSADDKIMVGRDMAVFTMLFTVACAGVFAFLAFRMRAGAKWARFILVAGSALLFARMLVVFIGGPVGPWAMAPVPLWLADGALATAAGAAVILASGRRAMEYFGLGGDDSGGGPGSAPGRGARRGGGKDGGDGR